MVNARAIATSSIVVAAGPAERFERIRAMLSPFAGRDLAVDEAVYASEQETGDRNRALAHLLRATGSLQGSVDDAVDVYVRQCSLVVTTCDLATMVATLAHGGVNPRTGERIVAERIAGHVLSVVATCGMYDYSGRWLLSVGLPAKSGVSGALVAVRPHQFGVGAYSPLLDERGNSVRGVEAMRALSERFDLHLMHDPGRPASPVYGVATCMTESGIDAEPGARGWSGSRATSSSRPRRRPWTRWSPAARRRRPGWWSSISPGSRR
jgi:glutaminase